MNLFDRMQGAELFVIASVLDYFGKWCLYIALQWDCRAPSILTICDVGLMQSLLSNKDSPENGMKYGVGEWFQV